MSYHDQSRRLRAAVAQKSAPGPIVPLSTLAKVYMFAPGHPKLPKRSRYARVIATRPDGTMTIEAFDAKRKKLGRVDAKWTQTGPVSPQMKTQVWWTKTGYFGPLVTPESEVGPVSMAPPPGIGSLLR